jgi:O-antigen/teichoic acid export membrane protein
MVFSHDRFHYNNDELSEQKAAKAIQIILLFPSSNILFKYSLISFLNFNFIMGIIARQGIKRSFLIIAGNLIGAFSVVFIYPLAKDAYGYAQYLLSFATLLGVFLSFGTSSLVVRFFPDLKEKFEKEFLTIIFIFAIPTFAFLTLLIAFFKNDFMSFLSKLNFDTDIISSNYTIIYLLSIVLVVISILVLQASNYRRIVIPYAINDLTFKVFLPVVIYTYFIGYFALNGISISLFVFYFLSGVAIAVYLKSLGGLNLGAVSFFDIPVATRKNMFGYMSFSGLNILGEILTTNIDRVMIPLLLSISSNGIYSIFLFMSNSVLIPFSSLYPIASPVISESMHKNDFENVADISKKTSLNGFIAGFLIFLLIWINIRDIVGAMHSKDELLPFINVFLLLGLAKLIYILAGVNTYILIYSKFYKYNLLFVLSLAGMNVVFNYFFINLYGISGAALATLLSVLIYNSTKALFIQLKFKINPFSVYTIPMVLIGTAVYLMAFYLPATSYTLLNIAYKSLLVSMVYYGLIKVAGIKAELITKSEKFVVERYEKLKRKFK